MNPKETYRGPVQLSAEQRRELQNARDHPSETVCPRAQCRPLADGRGQVLSLGRHPRSAQTEKARYALPLCQLVSDPRVGGLAGPSAGWSGAGASLTAAQNSSSDCVVDPSPLLLASQRSRAGRERESLPRGLGWRAPREVRSGSCCAARVSVCDPHECKPTAPIPTTSRKSSTCVRSCARLPMRGGRARGGVRGPNALRQLSASRERLDA